MYYFSAITSLWRWQNIWYNDVTSISIRNWSISRCKYNKKPKLLQYPVSPGIRIVLLEIWRECQSDPVRKIHLKTPILIGLIRDWIKVLAVSITKFQANKWIVTSQQVASLSNCNNPTNKCDCKPTGCKFTTLRVLTCEPTSFQPLNQQFARLRSQSK